MTTNLRRSRRVRQGGERRSVAPRGRRAPEAGGEGERGGIEKARVRRREKRTTRGPRTGGIGPGDATRTPSTREGAIDARVELGGVLERSRELPEEPHRERPRKWRGVRDLVPRHPRANVASIFFAWRSRKSARWTAFARRLVNPGIKTPGSTSISAKKCFPAKRGDGDSFARDRAAPIKPPREGAARGERDAPFPATRSSDSRATMPLGEFWIDLLSGWVGGAASVLGRAAGRAASSSRPRMLRASAM